MKNEILKGPYRKAIGKWYASRASAIELVFVIDYIGLDHEGKTQHSGTPIPIFDMITKSADRGVKYSKSRALSTFTDFRTDMKAEYYPKVDPDQIEITITDSPFRRAWLFKRVEPTPARAHSLVRAIFNER